MARVAGVIIPDNKRIEIALTYVYGIGLTSSQKILQKVNIDGSTRVKDLAEIELNKIRDYINNNHMVEGDLQRVVTGNIKRLKDLKSYRGLRHQANLPVRGQRTKTNARTKRGKRLAVAGAQPKAASKT